MNTWPPCLERCLPEGGSITPYISNAATMVCSCASVHLVYCEAPIACTATCACILSHLSSVPPHSNGRGGDDVARHGGRSRVATERRGERNERQTEQPLMPLKRILPYLLQLLRQLHRSLDLRRRHGGLVLQDARELVLRKIGIEAEEV